MANYTYQMSLEQTQARIVAVLSSTSSLFTLFLAASFPSNGGDKFTLSKLAAVVVSIFGLVSYKFINDTRIQLNKIIREKILVDIQSASGTGAKIGDTY